MEPGSQLVGVVARLEPEKGHPTLLEAWPKVLRAVPDAYLLIVGEGSRREALEAQARELRIAHRVVFTGRRDDVPAVTAALDVAVLPSYREAQGLSILEAMALSRPVVASNVGGIPEMIEDGRTGLLVPPHDADALAAAIIRLLKDHPFADTIGRAGHDLVHDRFCVELMVEPSRRSTTRARARSASTPRGRGRRLTVPSTHAGRTIGLVPSDNGRTWRIRACRSAPFGRSSPSRCRSSPPCSRRCRRSISPTNSGPAQRSCDRRASRRPTRGRSPLAGQPWLDQQWGAQMLSAAVGQSVAGSACAAFRAVLVGLIFGGTCLSPSVAAPDVRTGAS